MEKKQYQIEYEEFLDNYAGGTTTGEKVGEVIARLAQYYTEANLNYANALIEYNNKARQIEEQSDENTGKPISSTKAKVISSATVEASEMLRAKAHLENIEQKINALKSLQKGILQEYSHSGLS